MQLHINPHDETPVYRQIQHQITRAIVDREIHPGDLLASQQELAVQLAVSPSAVSKAYRELQSDGLCDDACGGHYRVTIPDLGSGRGSGTYLALSLLRRELLNQELRTAREVQNRLLPPSEISGKSWTISCRSYPAGALAGDFYEVIEHENGIVDIVIADVAGKGMAAGLLMATAKALVPQATTLDSPGATLGDLNDRLVPLLGNREFVAMACCHFDPRDGTLQIANAGLPDPYLLRPEGHTETLTVAGDRLPLGIRKGISYSTSKVSLASLDRLLLVTDGIPEAADLDGNPLGYEGLARLLDPSANRPSDTANGSTGPWLDRLLDQVSQRTGSMLDDDWTAVLLEYHRA
jgi:hypothetical protein